MAGFLVTAVINLLHEIGPRHLDECTVEELCQLQYALQRHQGSIFVKTVGRMAQQAERRGGEPCSND